jgi:hypothetical protein
VTWTDRRAPARWVRRLRKLSDVPDLQVLWDPDLRHWKFYSFQGGCWRVLVEWPHDLDGNLEALANRLLFLDYRRNGGRRVCADAIIDRERRRIESNRRSLRSHTEGFASYVRKRWAAVARGEVL